MVGVFLTCFDFLPLTRRCLESFRRTVDAPHRLIAVDNGSRDGTPEFLRREGVEVLTGRAPRSLPWVQNRARSHLLTDPVVDCLCWIHNDMVFYPGWLSGLLAVLERRPGAGKVSSWNLLDREYTEAEVAEFVRTQGAFLEAGNGNPWVIPRAAAEAVGPHDEGYVNHAEYEDWDYNNRLLAAGYAVLVTKGSVVWHRAAATRYAVRLDGEAANRRRYVARWGSDAPRVTNLY
ncbi:MAG: glycosyltransferase [Thermaerobacter sp.]|jgi:GT2 family glycosyltransferase|nr:glycosyltransferase [Thermaerobacter sp.]